MARASTAAAVTAVRRRAATAATCRSIGCRPAKARPGRPRRVASARAESANTSRRASPATASRTGRCGSQSDTSANASRDRQAGERGQAPPPRGPGDREDRADRDDDLRAHPAWSQPLGRNGRPHVDVHGAPAPRALEHGAPRRPSGAIVVHHGSGTADDGAARRVDPQPELDVVAAEAMRPALAEPAELPQDPAPVGDVGARAPVDLWIARGEDEAVAEAGRLRRPPRCAARPGERHQPQHRRHRAAVRCARGAMSCGVLDEQALIGHAVGVDEQHHLTLGEADAEIALPAHVVVGAQEARAVRLRHSRDPSCVVAGAAVDEDDVGCAPFACERLDGRGEAGEQAADQLAAAVRGGDDRDRDRALVAAHVDHCSAGNSGVDAAVAQAAPPHPKAIGRRRRRCTQRSSAAGRAAAAAGPIPPPAPPPATPARRNARAAGAARPARPGRQAPWPREPMPGTCGRLRAPTTRPLASGERRFFADGGR